MLPLVFSELEDNSNRLSAVELKHFIIAGLKNLHGEVRLCTEKEELNSKIRAVSAMKR